MLSRDRRADAGLIAIVGFLLFLLPYNQPFLPYGLSTILLLALITPLLTRRYERSLWATASSRIRG